MYCLDEVFGFKYRIFFSLFLYCFYLWIDKVLKLSFIYRFECKYVNIVD